MSFDTLGLSPKVLDAVKASGYETPTPIQQQAIPHVLQKRDVMGIAQTGTGKTASFVLPMLSMLEKGRARARMPRTLILEPTRELAAQVEENFNRYGRNHKLTVALLIGGVSFDDQFRKLDRGADVLIATPGRLLDHFERGKLLMSGVDILVIDEADRMLDMGFIPDIERIVKLVPFTRQTLFFSATMPTEIKKLSEQFLQNPVSVSVSPTSSASETIIQRAVAAADGGYEKRAVLRGLIDGADSFKNAIIFCNRKTEVSTLWRSLDKHGYSSGALHGDMDQRSRMAMLQAFKDDKIKLLVASDVAARGLDIPAVSHIFNYDVPVNAEDYVHRIGRTGRAGLSGEAFTIVTPADRKGFEAIESLLKQEIEWQGEPVEWEERGSRRRGGRSNARSAERKPAKAERKAPEKRQRPERNAEKTARDDGERTVARDRNRPRDNASHTMPSHGSAQRPKQPREKDGDHPFGGEEFVPAFLR
ncbi:MAG: DEAD/DEAH box helicase, partial [Salaquimonas sp.]|nr:DEAD/DEAH box helicase [Salaquimonas sp.]